MSKEIMHKNEMKMAADNIINQLTLSSECLAYEENIIFQDVSLEKITHRVLDIKKIENMEREFKFYEPNCTKRYGFGYYLVIEKFNLTRREAERSDVPPLSNKDVVIIIDATASMNEGDKISYAKSATKGFIDCASSDNRVGIVLLKDCGDVETFIHEGKELLELTEENRAILKNYIDGIGTYGNTAIKDSLREANRILKNSDRPERYKMIVLLTDGCESCGECECKKIRNGNGQTMCQYYEDYCNSCPQGKNVCDFVKENVDKNIHLFTVGLFTDIKCPNEEEKGGEQLECAARSRNGKYYFAVSTQKLGLIFCTLGRGIGEAREEKQLWVIGNKSHSLDKSLKGSLFVSVPVSIRYNETYTQSGRVTLYVFDGELEVLSNILDDACDYGESEGFVSLSYKTYLKRENNLNNICMLNGEKEFCKSIRCKKDVEFPVLLPGYYHLKVSSNANVVKVGV
ncbi:MAG: vWA domain-containing protein [Candidatus Micrarchaeia archaeon]